MKSFKEFIPRTINYNPPTFRQVVVQSDGSTFRIKTTSPKSILTLTRDCLNHPLWNPLSKVVDDSAGEILKFSNRFGELKGLEIGAAPSIVVKKVKAPVVEDTGKKKTNKSSK